MKNSSLKTVESNWKKKPEFKSTHCKIWGIIQLQKQKKENKEGEQ
jgi:hypothetical protein